MKNHLARYFPVVQYLNIPTIITLAGIYSSLVALYWVVNYEVHLAVFFALLAIACDQLDGLAARKMNKVSVFGGYLDVFGDFMAYCLFPVVAIYSLIGNALLLLPLLGLFLLVGSMRLAHYITTSTKDIVIGIPCCVLLIALPYSHKLPLGMMDSVMVIFILLSCGLFLSALGMQRSSFIGKILMALLLLTAIAETIRLFL